MNTFKLKVINEICRLKMFEPKQLNVIIGYRFKKYYKLELNDILDELEFNSFISPSHPCYWLYEVKSDKNEILKYYNREEKLSSIGI